MEERAVVSKPKLAPDVSTRFTAKAKSCVRPIAKSSGKAPNKVRGKVEESLLPGSVLGTIADAEVANKSKIIKNSQQKEVMLPFIPAELPRAEKIKQTRQQLKHADLNKQAEQFAALVDFPDSWGDLLASTKSMQSTLAGAKGMDREIDVVLEKFISSYNSVLEDSVRCTVSMTAEWLTEVNASSVSWTNTREVMLALKDIVCNAGRIELAESLEDSTKFYDLVSQLFVIAALHNRQGM